MRPEELRARAFCWGAVGRPSSQCPALVVTTEKIGEGALLRATTFAKLRATTFAKLRATTFAKLPVTTFGDGAVPPATAPNPLLDRRSRPSAMRALLVCVLLASVSAAPDEFPLLDAYMAVHDVAPGMTAHGTVA